MRSITKKNTKKEKQKKNRMPSFVDHMLQKHPEKTSTPEEVVEAFRVYFKSSYDASVKKGHNRQLSHLSSVQTNLSKFKKRVQASEEWKKGLHITKEEALELAKEKLVNLQKKSIHLEAIDGDQTLRDCRALLHHENVILRVIGLACLTGRRMSEILKTAQFDAPRETHARPNYWAHVSGLLKQRGNTKTCEIPLFAPRETIVQAITQVRKEIGVLPTTEAANARYGKLISRAMHRFCPSIGNIHAFRRFYVLACDTYFNENHAALPLLGSQILCHRDLGAAVIPYLSIRVVNLGNLDFPSSAADFLR